MTNSSTSPPPTLPLAPVSVFTIVAGTTIPDRARIVRAHCRQGFVVELRRLGLDEPNGPEAQTPISVWLPCPSWWGLVRVRKKIGYVPVETARRLDPARDESATRVARGTVRTVYAPVGRDEAVVTVEVMPQTQQSKSSRAGLG